MILPKIRDKRFVTLRRGGTLTDEDHHLLAVWAAECAGHVLHLFEKVSPHDDRPRRAVEAAYAWTRGEITMKQSRAAAGAAQDAAREVKAISEAARLAALSAGQAAVVAHVAAHELGAAAYAIRAAMVFSLKNQQELCRQREWEWQRSRLPEKICALVLDDQINRNDICWYVFKEALHMQPVKLGSPLFILRDKCAEDLENVFRQLAARGFEGVELLGLFGHEAAEVRRMLDAYGLKALGNHVPYDEFVRDTGRVIKEHRALGCGYITVAAPAAEGLPGGARYAETVTTLERLGALLLDEGMKLLFHNHAGELKQAGNGKTFLENLLDDTDPERLFLEPDLGWMAIAGADPAYYLKKYVNRCPVIHFKDYYPGESTREDDFTFRPIGYGVMDHARLFPLARACAPAWYVTDHDCAYTRDPFEDLDMSLRFLQNLIRINADTH